MHDDFKKEKAEGLRLKWMLLKRLIRIFIEDL